MLKAQNLRHVGGSILFLFLSLQATAQVFQLTDDRYVRSSMDFLLPGNRIGVLHKGSTFRVLSRTPLRGGDALEIQPIALSSNSHVDESPSGKIYLYKPNSSEFHSSQSVEAGVDCVECQRNSQTIGSVTQAFENLTEKAYDTANRADAATVSPEDISQPTVGPHQAGALDAKIKNYSSSSEVQGMIDWAMRNKKRASTGKCYRTVKRAMAGHLLPSASTALKDAYALSAKTELKKSGFINLLETEPYKSQMRSPTDAPKGAILVYSSGVPCTLVSRPKRISVRDCGHAEIKTGNPGEPGYVSDYYSADAVNETPRARKFGSNYKLVGIMIKPRE